jgi:hypothetical protein
MNRTTAEDRSTSSFAKFALACKPPGATAEDRKEAKRFYDHFGSQGVVWYSEGKTFDEARKLHRKSTADERRAIQHRTAGSKSFAKFALGCRPPGQR